MLDIKAILATLTGVVVVGGVGAYVYLENSNPEDQVIQANTNPAITALENSQSDASTPEISSDDVDKDTEVSDDVADPQEEVVSTSDEPTKNWKIPAFDILRVEPDGSTVIAGKGQPNTTLKVMNGDEVLDEIKIGSSGDFAVIFDEPLASGDYQLSLRVEDEDGNALVSDETAVVSVPEEAGGQLLAMVTEPGKASRILAQPEAPAQAASKSPLQTSEDAEVAANTATTESNVEVKTEEVASAVDTKESIDAAVVELAKEKDTSLPETFEVKTDVGEVINKADNSDASVVENEQEAEKHVTAEMANSDDEPMAGDDKDVVVSNDVSTTDENTVSKELEIAKDAAEAEVKDVAENIEAASQEAMANATEKAVTEVQPQDDSVVRIEAVEVEGDKLFVAGVASKGNTVRILVDGNEVGAVDVDGEGRFLIEAQQELSVGSHMITAALEDKTTKTIILQAVVPFNRPEAESAAAIATKDSNPGSKEVTVANEGNNQADVDKIPAMATDVASNDAKTAPDSSDDSAKTVEVASETTINVETPKADNTEAKPEAAMVKADGGASNGENEPQTIVQDTLTPAESQSVIIRKGDTLWQIARRTYGAGVRYTTIYLANEEQIQNPDKIEPGQIFTVPDEALENAEELHQQRLQGN